MVSSIRGKRIQEAYSICQVEGEDGDFVRIRRPAQTHSRSTGGHLEAGVITEEGGHFVSNREYQEISGPIVSFSSRDLQTGRLAYRPTGLRESTPRSRPSSNRRQNRRAIRSTTCSEGSWALMLMGQAVAVLTAVDRPLRNDGGFSRCLRQVALNEPFTPACSTRDVHSSRNPRG